MAEEEFARMRKRMVEEQIVARGIRGARVLTAMGNVPRHCFIQPGYRARAYSDGPLPIGNGQTISQPYIVALMTELLGLEAGDRVLEIGTGSGYQAAILAESSTEVDTVELIPELAQEAEKTLAGLGYTRVHVHTSDGSAGWKEAAPYDRILVAAAAPVVPQPLLDQLVEGGRLIIPVGSLGVQVLEVWMRTENKYTRKANVEVCFVPLRGQFGWR
jgi:protein-L-isoaspartate(D-aspartate) O-methyltransferase